MRHLLNSAELRDAFTSSPPDEHGYSYRPIGQGLALRLADTLDALAAAEAKLAAVRAVKDEHYPETAEAFCLLADIERALGDVEPYKPHPDSPAGQGFVFDAARMHYVPGPSS